MSCDVFPPFDVSNGDWGLGLIDLSTYNSIPNIEKNVNDKFYYGSKEITIDEGAYEIEDLELFIKNHIEGASFTLKANINTLKVDIWCSESIDFTKPNSINTLLGFSKKILEPNKTHVSDNPVDIVKVNVIRVECNIVRGSFDNGRETHVIHEFYPIVAPGFKIVEIPNTIIYLPINVHSVTNITVTLKDQDNRLINLRNEIVSLRVHLKQISRWD